MRAAFLTDQAKKIRQFVKWFQMETQQDTCETCADALSAIDDGLESIALWLHKIEQCRPVDVAKPGDYVFGDRSDVQDPEIIRHIRPEMLQALMRYVQTGGYLGDFLTAVVENNLSEAVSRADEENRENLYDIVRLLYNYCPSSCWGSKEKRTEWQNHGGLQGLREEAQGEQVRQ